MQTRFRHLPNLSSAVRNPGALLLCLCLLTLLPFLGDTLFHTRGEPREAVVALSMLHDGNWVLPVNNGVDIAYKPPLLHWCIAAVSTLTGSVTEYTSRLPSALALTAMILTGFLFYARRCGTAVALLAALITLSNFEVHRAGVACRVDMLLAALMVMALYALYRWSERGLRGLPWAAIACLAGAALTKGPVGLLLPVAVTGLFLLVRGHKPWPVVWKLAAASLLGLVPLCGWYAAAYGQGGDHFLRLIYEENVLRLTGRMSYASHENPWHYNLVMLAAGLLPYTLLVLLSLFTLRRTCKGRHPSSAPHTAAGPAEAPAARRLLRWPRRLLRTLRAMDPVRLFTLTCAVGIFAFYCIPKSKRGVYLLPMYPFTAYFLAEYMLWLCRRTAVVKCFGGTMAVLAALLTATFLAVRAGFVPPMIFSGRHAAENAAFLQALATVPVGLFRGLVILVPVCAAAAWFTLSRRRTHPVRQAFGATLVVVSLFFALDGFYQPTVLNVKSDRPQAAHIARIVPRGRVWTFRPDVVPGNRMHPFTINFYLGDRMAPFDDFMPKRGYLVAGNDDIDAWRERFPAYAAALVYDSGHRSCDDKRVVRLYRFWKRGR